MPILRRTFRSFLIAALLLVTAHRLPAPITEIPEPTATPKAKPKKANAENESRSAAKTASTPSLRAGPVQEKAFIDKYKAAFDAGDKATLQSFLYTQGANPMALDYYKMMLSEGAGSGRISKIELVDLTPEDVKKASEIQNGRGGGKAQLPLKPTKKLKITIEIKDAASSSSSSSENFVAEKDGNYVIPVPATVK